MSHGQRKSHGAAIERTVNLSHELREVKGNLQFLLCRKAAVDKGECYESGQPCANAPSKLAAKAANLTYGDFLRATVPAGAKVELICDETLVTLKRINLKTVSIESQNVSSTWEHLDVKPLNPDGSRMDDLQFKTALKEWRAKTSA